MFHRNRVFLTVCYSVLLTDAAIIPIRDEKGRLSVVEWTNYNYREPEGYGTYAFGYDIDDPETNNVQFRNEEKLANGSVVGSYGYLGPNGDVFIVTYIADERGYRARFENPLKLSFLRPQDPEEDSNISNGDMLRIVTPSENTSNSSNNNSAQQQSLTHEESNAFYYPQNILDSAEFNQNELNVSKGNMPPDNKFQELPSNFNSEKEENAFYYPQNILDSTDFHKPENHSDNITFQKKIETVNETPDPLKDDDTRITNYQTSSKALENARFSYAGRRARDTK